MATLELILLLLAAVLASAVIEQFLPKVAAPLIQIVLGIFIEVFTADTVNITFGADLFLVLFIAPLLYDEARRADKKALLANIRPVLALAIGLVLVTMFAVGGVVHWLVPAIPFAAACMLGAALGPTDAVAVGSLPKEVDLGERRKQILQGEYLLNDASGIVGFQFALAVAVGGAFSAGGAVLEFAKVFFGGLIVGAILGLLANAIERYFRNIGVENTTFHVLFDIFMPFIIYLTAEPVGASGIIAVVVGGLIRSLANRGVEPVTSRLNIVSDSVWQTISFALNGTVFVLLGTQLPRAMTYTLSNPAIGNENLMVWTLIVTVVLLGVRFIWLVGQEYLENRKHGAKLFSKETAYSALLMTIAGPKGAVTLSIIFTMPVLLNSEAFFPERSLIIFLASGVILLTLLLSNFVLPLFAPRRNLTHEEMTAKERDTQASIDVLRSVVQGLVARQTAENAVATDQVIGEYNRRIAQIQSDNDISADETLDLRLACFAWERDFVTADIESGDTDPLIGYRYINRIDRRENALLHRSERINVGNIWNEIRERVKALWRALRQRIEPNSAAQADALREVQARSYRLMIKRLKREMSGGTYPAEAVSAVLLDYQRALGALKARTNVAHDSDDWTVESPSRLGEIARLAEVEQAAITLELEAIAEAYEGGRLSRTAAKRLREDVTLMQVDLSEG